MINFEWQYYAKFVKHPKDTYTAFSVGVKDKKTGNWKNYNIFCFDKVDIKDGDKFKFTKVISVDQTEYNNKSQFQITAEIEVTESSEPIASNKEQEPIAQHYYNEVLNDEPIVQDEPIENDEPILDITADDLPF